MLPPSAALAGPTVATARSAAGPTIEPVAVAESFALLKSAVLPLTEAMFEKFAPGDSVPGAETTSWKVSVLPGAILALADSVTVPPDWPKLKTSVPTVCAIDTNVDPAGRVSVRTTALAALGP